METNGVRPEVGMGASYSVGSDRYPCTVIAVSYFKSGTRKGALREVTVQDDDFTMVGGNAFSESQEYDFQRNTSGATCTFRPTKWGALKSSGSRFLSLGTRRAYRDPSF